MKTTKRVLSIALTLLLGFALLAPGVMAEANPNAPIVIAAPPEEIRRNIGETLVLEVEAKLPEGVQGELSYEWSTTYNPFAEPIGAGPKLTWTIPEDAGTYHVFSVKITNTYVDGEGETQTAFVYCSTRCNIRKHVSILQVLLSLGGAILGLPLTLIGLVFVPLAYLLLGAYGTAYLALILMPVIHVVPVFIDVAYQLFGRD